MKVMKKPSPRKPRKHVPGVRELYGRLTNMDTKLDQLRSPAVVDRTVQSLIDRMPPPDAIWPEAVRARWLVVLRATFEMIYREK
jgi:hypothetical protein